VERIGRITPVRRGVGQRTDDVGELDERAGPAMRQEQRCRVRLGGALVDEMYVHPVYDGLERCGFIGRVGGARCHRDDDGHGEHSVRRNTRRPWKSGMRQRMESSMPRNMRLRRLRLQ
jgi:hypothetical protein